MCSCPPLCCSETLEFNAKNSNVFSFIWKAHVFCSKDESKKEKVPGPLSSSAWSRQAEFGVWGKRPEMTEKFFCLSLCSLCCTLPHFLFLFSSRSDSDLGLSWWKGPGPLLLLLLHSHTLSLCFTNWSHSESTGRKTKRDIPPFFSTSPWPHTRSAHICAPLLATALGPPYKPPPKQRF